MSSHTQGPTPNAKPHPMSNHTQGPNRHPMPSYTKCPTPNAKLHQMSNTQCQATPNVRHPMPSHTQDPTPNAKLHPMSNTLCLSSKPSMRTHLQILKRPLLALFSHWLCVVGCPPVVLHLMAHDKALVLAPQNSCELTHNSQADTRKLWLTQQNYQADNKTLVNTIKLSG